jgi:DNA polymerase elongation subunit (family B)
MRYIAKLLLNSLWGKFAQRNRLGKTAVFTTENAADYFALFLNPSTEVTQIIPICDGVIRVLYTEKKDFVRENANSNTVVALYTTAIARMRLFSYLENILQQPGCTILYTDTDSVMFKHPRNTTILQSGRYLGEMSEEYSGFEIEKFISAGPKYVFLFIKTFFKFRFNYRFRFNYYFKTVCDAPALSG